MNEQSLWIGEEQLELRPPTPDIDSMAEEHLKPREKSYQAALFLAADLRSQASIPGDDALKDDVNILLNAPHSPYSERWEIPLERGYAFHEQVLQMLSYLKNQVVLDLGSGPDSRNFQNILSRFQPKGYIGVDTHSYFGPRRSIKRLEGVGDVVYLDEMEGDKLEGLVIRGDMLKVASRLPEHSVSIALNGIDEFVVNSRSPYGERLAVEVKRILDPEGVIIGITGDSGILEVLAADQELQTVKLPAAQARSNPASFYFIEEKSPA